MRDYSRIRIAIFNILGQLVRMVELEYYEMGQYKFIWDGSNEHGISVPSGIYLVRFQVVSYGKAKEVIWVKKVSLLK